MNSKKTFFFLFFFLILSEIFSAILVNLNLLPVNKIPGFYQSFFFETLSVDEWRTEKDSWGSWHKKNSRAIHKSKCFEYELSSNNVGARDNQTFKKNDEKKILLIGDSAAEGWGVSIDNTSQFYIENELNIEIYNFGSGGGLGPVSYYHKYKDLIKEYDNNNSILMIYFAAINDFLENDFNDDSEKFVLSNSSKEFRYRPYFRKDGTIFNSFIPENAIKRESTELENQNKLKKFISDYFWSYNILRSLRKLKYVYSNKVDDFTYAGYYDAELYQQEAAVYFIKKIIEISKSRKIAIVGIPYRTDVTRKLNGDNTYKNLFWYNSFLNLDKKFSNKDIIFIDTLEVLFEEDQKTFHPKGCDNHYNEFGNKLIASFISSKLRKIINN